jgi:hypothetical protein
VAFPEAHDKGGAELPTTENRNCCIISSPTTLPRRTAICVRLCVRCKTRDTHDGGGRPATSLGPDRTNHHRPPNVGPSAHYRAMEVPLLGNILAVASGPKHHNFPGQGSISLSVLSVVESHELPCPLTPELDQILSETFMPCSRCRPPSG